MPRADRAAAARILARYKRAVLLGQEALPFEVARRLVGPDTAYHLYQRTRAAERASRASGRRRQRGS